MKLFPRYSPMRENRNKSWENINFSPKLVSFSFSSFFWHENFENYFEQCEQEFHVKKVPWTRGWYPWRTLYFVLAQIFRTCKTSHNLKTFFKIFSYRSKRFGAILIWQTLFSLKFFQWQNIIHIIFIVFIFHLLICSLLFLNRDLLHARLNSHYEAESYKKKKHKKIKAYGKYVKKEPAVKSVC